MYQVGITGGIGSGKTTVCRIFETLGIAVYYADIQAKLLMNTDLELKDALEKYFGKDIYAGGSLNRSRLSEMIFTNETALKKVNALVHPAVNRDFQQWSRRQTSPYVLEESAILIENDLTREFRKIILVTAPDALRVQRVCARDGVDPATVLARIKNQWPEEKKIPLADYVIYNDESGPPIAQVQNIHLRLMEIVQKTESGS